MAPGENVTNADDSSLITGAAAIKWTSAIFGYGDAFQGGIGTARGI